MADVTLRVISSNLITPIAGLDQPYGMRWADEGLDSGILRFTVPSDDPSVQANPTILDRDNLVILQLDGADTMPFVIRRRRRKRGDVWDPIDVTCLGALELLRSGLVEYARGVGTGIPSDERPFGWMAIDYDDSGGCWVSPAPYSGGLQRNPRFSIYRDQPPMWPDGRAEWIGPEALFSIGGGNVGHTPDDYWYLRHRMQGSYSGEAALFITADDEFLAYFNGVNVAEGADWRTMTRVPLTMTGDDVLALQVYNAVPTTGDNPTAVVYTVAIVDDDGEIDRVLFRSTSGSVFSESRDAVQSVVLDPDQPPFPWGSSYPSTGPDGITGTWNLVFRGQTTAAIQWDANAAAVQSALEALSNVGAGNVTVTGSGTSASPWIVTFTGDLGGRVHPNMDIIHDDLRHDHSTTRVRTLTTGRAAEVSSSGSGNIRVCPFPGEPPGVTIGYILKTLFDEWQTRGGLAPLSIDFDAVTDSRGVPWADEIVFVCQVGNDNVLSVGERLRELGVDLWMTTDLTFRAAQQRGDDRTGDVTFALDVVHGLETESEDEIINALLVRTDDAWFRRGSPAAGTRREAFLTLGLQPDAQSSIKIADANLAALARARQIVPFVVTSSQPGAPVPYVDFFPMDEVQAPWVVPTLIAGAWSLTTVRIDTIAGEVDVVGDVEWLFEVEA